MSRLRTCKKLRKENKKIRQEFKELKEQNNELADGIKQMDEKWNAQEKSIRRYGC